MKSSIVSVGTELLFGQIVNTNAVYLSQELNMLGIDVLYHHTIGDNPERLSQILKLSLQESDLIITTGGLGPTQDDMTKDIVCQVFEDELVRNEEIVEKLKSYFHKLNRPMTENNLKQAYFPSRAVILDNERGTAPGFLLENKGKYIISLPGPPVEMKSMFQNHVVSFLEELTDSSIYYKMVRMFGIGESALETLLMPLVENQTDPTLATYAKAGETSVRVASKRKTLAEAEKAVADMIEDIRGYAGDYIYSIENDELHQVVADKLMERNITISAAESCTGGWFAQSLTKVSGVSKVFDRSIVTYSDRAKVEELGVKQETLDKFGAVSKETAIEMAQGIKKVSGSDIAISVTGIAGPSGGTEEKPVGLVYISLIFGDEITTNEYRIRNVGRDWIRSYVSLYMFDMINRALDGRGKLVQ